MIYLSTGAWNVAPTLTRFLSRNLFPAGSMLLTDWGPTHDRWFRSGREHKLTNLDRLAAEFPHVRWLLIGDDGQHDEAIYRQFLGEHPESVAAVAIRRLLPAEAVLAGRRAASRADSEADGRRCDVGRAPRRRIRLRRSRRHAVGERRGRRRDPGRADRRGHRALSHGRRC